MPTVCHDTAFPARVLVHLIEARHEATVLTAAVVADENAAHAVRVPGSRVEVAHVAGTTLAVPAATVRAWSVPIHAI